MSTSEKIQEHLKNGGVVIISTYTKSWQYDKIKQADNFKTGIDGHLYILHGKKWVDGSGCAIKFYTYAK